jgi:hypothetical protein
MSSKASPALLLALLSLLAVAASASAEESRHLYERIPYADEEFVFEAPGGDLGIAFENRGEEPTRLILEQSGHSIRETGGLWWGVTRFSVEPGEFSVNATGTGIFAIVHPDFGDNLDKDLSEQIEHEGRFAFVFNRDDKTTYVCLQSSGPMDVEITNDAFESLESAEQVQSYNGTFDTNLKYLVAFIETEEPGTLGISITHDPCGRMTHPKPTGAAGLLATLAALSAAIAGRRARLP